MATTVYFDETIKDQGGKGEMDVELGRSSYYARCKVPSGIGEDSIYLVVDGCPMPPPPPSRWTGAVDCRCVCGQFRPILWRSAAETLENEHFSMLEGLC